MKTKTERKDVYQIVTDRIVDQLEKGVVPWRQPWKNAGTPMNLVSKKPYRGINPFLLAAASYDSPYWVTFNQAKDLGGRVKAGEHGWPVIFWKRGAKEETSDDGVTETKTWAMLRYFTVFNTNQTSGLEEKIPKLPTREHTPIEECERLVANMPKKPEIKNEGDRACYNLLRDDVTMPPANRFESSEHYYKVLFHELGHATGAAARVGRFTGDTTQGHFGSQSYSQEELVAEMTAAFLAGVAGIEAVAKVEDSAAYINSWLQRLNSDRKLVVVAAAQAQKAADFIQGVSQEAQAHEEG